MLFVVVVACYATGCATISRGFSNKVLIESEPAGATVRINGEVRGVTPLKVKLDRGQKEHRVVLELEGHRPWSDILRRSVNGWYYANIFLNSGLGMIPDALLGTKYSYSTNNISANLLSQREWEERVARQRAETEARERARERQRASERERARERERQREEERRKRLEQFDWQIELVREDLDDPRLVEYYFTAVPIILAPMPGDEYRVSMSIHARWPTTSAAGTLRADNVLVFFQFSNVARGGKTRYSKNTGLSCFAGEKPIVNLREEGHWELLTFSSGDRQSFIEELSVIAKLSDLSRILEARGPVRCRLGEDWFLINPGILQGILKLKAVIPVR